MTELLDLVVSWQALTIALLAFGLTPGVVLRLLVLAYPKGHPRRQELLAELRVVPWAERPLWVIEKLEVALFDGLPERRRAKRVRKADGGRNGDSSPFNDFVVEYPLYQQVAEQLRKAIDSGWWPPGHKLPRESELMKQFGVSKVTIRLALGMLRIEGVISPGEVSFVSAKERRRQRLEDYLCKAAASGNEYPIYYHVAARLRHSIESGEWPAGHKLPRESELMKQFDVSRVTVRLSMGVLRELGMITTRQGSGSFVCDRQAAELVETPEPTYVQNLGVVRLNSDYPIYRQVAARLRHSIESGEWPAGHKLPRESELMKRFDVSRVTVRLSMGVLRELGMITTRQGIGSFVCERDEIRFWVCE